MKAFGSFFLLKYFVKRLFGVAACQRLRQATFWRRCVPASLSSDFLRRLRASESARATFWRRCVPAAPSCDILGSLRASGAVMRHFKAPACQWLRHATFWGACVPAAPSCDILGSLRVSGSVMRHFEAPACQRLRHATFWGACVPAAPSCDILGSTFDPASPVSESPAIERRSAPASTAAPLYIKV